MPKIVHCGNGDRFAAKIELSAQCPFCEYRAPSNNVRRHIQTHHPSANDISDILLINGFTYHILDSQHPKIVIASAEKGDFYHKHQAYCFGCHHRILCLSKQIDKATEECKLHVCKQKQARTYSDKKPAAVVEVKPAEVSGKPDWKAVLDIMTKKRPAIKKMLDSTLEEYPDEEWEDIAFAVFSDMDGQLRAASNSAERLTVLLEEAKQNGYNRGHAAAVESQEQSSKVKDDNHAAEVALLKSQNQSLKSRVDAFEAASQTIEQL
jgi:hypothetical protein